MAQTPQWWDEVDSDEEEDSDATIREYDISASPNDFNVLTIMSFLESERVRIPAFQRNYVWDIKKASKLIESITIGLPIPQIFLFEESKNNFLVIDGQQRLMSIYYFIKRRFPIKEKRVKLREIFDTQGKLPDNILYDDKYFTDFNLRLNDETSNPLHGLNYKTLGDLQTQFDLRTIRNVIIKQNLPSNDASSMYEIFNRLNSGGVNLGSQEIRASLFHSTFYTMLYRINALPRWREFTGLPEADLHMKDIEIILRGFALLFYGNEYKPSMTRFLNEASRKLQSLSEEDVAYLEKLFGSFLDACSELPAKAFHGKSGAFSISVFDAVFAAVCRKPLEAKGLVTNKVELQKLQVLQNDAGFIEATQFRTAGQGNVKTRLQKATSILG
jgi:uncharacterized protein with ParB-like and HNH nuclease domain